MSFTLKLRAILNKYSSFHFINMEDIKETSKYLGTIEIEESVLGVIIDRSENVIYAGYICNTGIGRQYEMPIDDATDYDALEGLCDLIYEQISNKE